MRGSQSPAGRSTSGAEQLIVLQSFRALSRTSNPYLAQLVDAMPADITIVPFSWRFALLSRYQVFHVQWPELLVRGRNRGRTMLRRGLFWLLLQVAGHRRVAIVRTVHNIDPHDSGSPVERMLLDQLDRRTNLWVTLNESTPVPVGSVGRTIAHGHYRQWFSEYPIAGTIPGRVLYFGLVRAYKGVENLVEAFVGMPDPSATLRIVGKPDPKALGDRITESGRSDSRVSTQLSYVSDADLAREVGEAVLVVLPYTEIHNSGSLLLALSLDRPVLVPDAPTTVALRDEVGADWVLLFQPPLTADALRRALEQCRLPHSEPHPDLSRRDWPALGQKFADVYREATRLVGGRRRYSE